MSAVKHTPATARIQRRLERLELEHLRQHAAELAERLEEAERRLSHAEYTAEFWHDQAFEMHNTAADAVGGMPGITMDGQLVVLPASTGALQ